MLWEIQIQPRLHDGEQRRINEEYRLLMHGQALTSRGSGGPWIPLLSSPRLEGVGGPLKTVSQDMVTGTAHGYLLEGDLAEEQVNRLLEELLLDPLVETGQVGSLNVHSRPDCLATVLLKPGVMDPVALSVVSAARDLGITVRSVRTFRRYFGPPSSEEAARILLSRVLANDAIEQVVTGPLDEESLTLGSSYTFQKIIVPVRDLDDQGLGRLSQEGQLALSLAEMQTIQAHFQTLGRDPTDVELETLAQTWSEHCSHKTLKGIIHFEGEAGKRTYQNMLKETIFDATQQVRQQLGEEDFCVSVFEDNAGVVRFDDRFHVCFKVETHNHPSALEPYGGANTGLGGVIRDPLGTGLGAKPICNTDVFCFAPPDTPPETLPSGVLHPLKVMKGVVAGVRDYGNRMGIPTVNGAVCFDERYLGNPLVYCGTVGLIPVDRCQKEARAGDLIVAVGGRTGRDGIHGATFSSIGLTSSSSEISGGAVQIGNAITEKKLLDVLLQARDANLYHAITDCGAGGFSSAVGEMGANLGARVDLERAPLKYTGLSYTEIWISEAQERMILAVPSAHWPQLQQLCASEDVEAIVLGEFEATGRLRLFYQGEEVGDLDMDFLHNGRPRVVRQAVWALPDPGAESSSSVSIPEDYTDTLKRILSSPNVCSKEWIIRQYDHEVQGGSIIKPLVGVANDGPGDAAVVLPVLDSWRGLAVGCGINPRYGDLDPYAMAAAAIDEAVRNVVAVGADPARIALLDNFCWGNTDRPEVLGSLVRAAEACRDLALAYRMPFISGKDSLKNEFHAGGRHLIIPPTLLISALGQVPDVRRCVTMDLKDPGNVLYLVGVTRPELGGSHYHLVHEMEGGTVPRVQVDTAPRLFARVHQAIHQGLVRSCHDLSEGGLAVTLAEMAFAGGIGAEVRLGGGGWDKPPRGSPVLQGQSGPDHVLLFSESTTRFVIEVSGDSVENFEDCLQGVAICRLGETVAEPRLHITGATGSTLVDADLAELKEAWQAPLRG